MTRQLNPWPRMRDVDALVAERHRLRAQRAAVLNLHQRSALVQWCRECARLWPCPTARAFGVRP